jgi:polyhydroxyalkanoate synthesis regulator phasin
MTDNSKNDDATVLSRLASRGEEAVTKLLEEMSKNPRVTEALGKAMSAKGAVDEKTRQTLRQIGLAAADEIKDLRGNLEKLEKRLAKLEDGKAPAKKAAPAKKPAAKKPAAKKPAAKKPAAKKPAAKKPAPKKPPAA